MKGSTLRAKLESLGIVSSYSRLRVINDNPYVESLFKTLKYCPQWPTKGFSTLENAMKWMLKFEQFYNHEHRHSGIRYVALLGQRKVVYELAKSKYTGRWSGRQTRNWTPIGAVSLNPDREIVPVQAAA